MSGGKIFVLGAGAWGTALAASFVRASLDVTLWAKESKLIEPLSSGDGNPLYLPGIDLPAIPTVNDYAGLASSDVILAVVPAQYTRGIFKEIVSLIHQEATLVLCAKGIEQGSLKTMAEVAREEIPQAKLAVLSGPSFAKDVAMGLPTAVTLAVEEQETGEHLQSLLGHKNFRPYLSLDVKGAEIGGAVKNVLAIACGIVDGLELGRSAHAAMISRGFAEMTRLGVAMGGRAETLAGLCGLGDLVLTCSSPQSRNMSFGSALGRGRDAATVLASRSSVTEGAATAPALLELAKRYDVDMPICEAVADILSGEADIQQAMTTLLSRPYKEEF